MRKPRPGIVLAVAIPFLSACFRVQELPVPAPELRRDTEIRGVVLNGERPGRVEFDEIDAVTWTDSTVVVSGVLRSSDGTSQTGTVTSRSFPLSSLSGVLVRRVDVNRTSILIAVVTVGSIVIASLLLTGQTDEGEVIGGIRE